jgi:hypothetical protein
MTRNSTIDYLIEPSVHKLIDDVFEKIKNDDSNLLDKKDVYKKIYSHLFSGNWIEFDCKFEQTPYKTRIKVNDIVLINELIYDEMINNDYYRNYSNFRDLCFKKYCDLDFIVSKKNIMDTGKMLFNNQQWGDYAFGK